jgi:hypothetical protein
MAAHRAMQAANIPVTASAPMSGPYALAAQSDATFYGNVNAGGTIFTPMIFTSFQKAYGIYNSPSEVYESAYATGIETLLPGIYDFTTVVTSLKLPQLALFNKTPPTAPPGSGLQPTLDAITPPVTGAATDALFEAGFGIDNLIKNSARLDYLLDAMAHPDGAVPPSPTGNGLTATGATNKLRIAAKTNDLRGWTPQAPVLLCAGNGDPTVFYSLNTGLMATLWGAAELPAGLVTVLDVDSAPTGAGDPFVIAKMGFADAKNKLITAAGAAAVTGAYHGTLVPPYCNAAAKSFFDKVLSTPSPT